MREPTTSGWSARDVAFVAVIIMAAAAIGLPEGSLGVLWPSISEGLGVPIDRLGLLLYAATAGYLVVALAHGRIVRRRGTAVLLASGAAVGVVGASVFAMAAGFPIALAAYFAVGAAAGALDTGLNGYVSIHRSRLLPIMHGGFGIGATVGPWAVTALRDAGVSWRVALVGLAIYEAVLLVVFVLVRGWFHTGSGEVTRAEDDLLDIDVPLTAEPIVVRDAPGTEAIDLRPASMLLPLIVAAFFLYVGIEAGIGAWGYTLLVDRGVDPTTAGRSVALYFASIMVGRFAIGAAGGRLGPRRILPFAIAGAVACSAALLVAGDAVAGLGPLVFVPMGLCLAGIFPSLVALNPERLGTARTTAAIGWQLAAASIGLATLPALIGIAVGRIGASSIAPALLVAAAGLATVHAIAVVIERRDDTPTPELD